MKNEWTPEEERDEARAEVERLRGQLFVSIASEKAAYSDLSVERGQRADERERLTAEIAQKGHTIALLQAERESENEALRRLTAEVEHARTPDRAPPLSQAIAAEHARQEAEQGSPVARARRDLFTKLVHVDHMARHLCENSAIDHTVDPANPTAVVDPDDLTALEEALSAVDPDEGHDEQTRARMMAVFATDASRPGLTEEQARIFAPIVAAQSTSWPIYSVLQKLADAADHLLRGHGCDRHGYEEVEGARTAAREILGATGIEPGRFTARFAVDDRCTPAPASRGEPGPAPTWGEQAIAEHHRAAEPEPFEKIEQLPPTLGPGIGGAPIRVRPTAAPDPRATLHAGDPEHFEYDDALDVLPPRTNHPDGAFDHTGLAGVVAASAREPHADVVLQALHVSGGAAAVAGLGEPAVLGGRGYLSTGDRFRDQLAGDRHVEAGGCKDPACEWCDNDAPAPRLPREP